MTVVAALAHAALHSGQQINLWEPRNTIYTTANYKFGFVTIVMDPKSLETTDEFKREIREALGAQKTDEEKTAALREVFEKFGHSFPTEVTLGGALVSTDSAPFETEVSLLRNGSPNSSTVNSLQTKEAQKNFESEMKAKVYAAVARGETVAVTDYASFQSYHSERSALSEKQYSTIRAIVSDFFPFFGETTCSCHAPSGWRSAPVQ